MTHPEVVEMRRRLVEIYRLYRAAVRNGYRDEARKLINAWSREEITTEELIEKLRKLTER